MTKAIREIDVVFDKTEMILFQLELETKILQAARIHFLDEGWTEEEIDERIEFGNVEKEFIFMDKGTHIEHMMTGLRVPVEIKQKIDI